MTCPYTPMRHMPKFMQMTVHTSHKDQTVVQVKLQNSSTDFKSWCILHKMFVNLTKTSSMSIGSKQNLSNRDDLFITIDDEDISNVDNQKLLGIIIDKTPSCDKQINSVCLNITRRITLLKLLSKYVDMPNLKLYYNSYILPIFDYGCMIRGQCSAYNIRDIRYESFYKNEGIWEEKRQNNNTAYFDSFSFQTQL